MIDSFIQRKMAIPPFENLNGVDAATMHSKIREFRERLPKCNCDLEEFFEGYFLELLHFYPNSFCAYGMNDTLKLLISIYYHDSKLDAEEWNLNEKDTPGFSAVKGMSYEDLAILFVRSKASIHEAIESKGAQALFIAQTTRQQGKNEQKEQTNAKSDQTNEQPPRRIGEP